MSTQQPMNLWTFGAQAPEVPSRVITVYAKVERRAEEKAHDKLDRQDMNAGREPTIYVLRLLRIR